MSRSQQLLAVADALLQTHAEWADGDSPMTEDFATAVDDTIEVFANGDLPSDCRELAAIVAHMESAWEVYKAEAAAQDDPNYLPSQAFWSLLHKLRSARIHTREGERHFTLETIEDLIVQKVSPTQICRMYGFVDEQGREQLWKLEEERQKPGTHTDRAKGWLPPQERRHREKQAKAQEALLRVNKRMTARINQVANKAKPAPEPWDELILAGNSAEQIATLKRCTVEEVYAKADELGLDRPPLNYNDSLANAEIKPVKEEAIASLTHGADRQPELSSDDDSTDDAEVEEFIISLVDQGSDDATIKEAVSQQYGRRINVRTIERIRKTLETTNS